MLAVSIKVFYGDTSTIVRENTSLLQDTPLTLRLGFPDDEANSQGRGGDSGSEGDWMSTVSGIEEK